MRLSAAVLVDRLPRPARTLVGVLSGSRILGLSAECAFWITFTLPWIALGLLSSVGAIASRVDPASVAQFEQSVLTAAGRVMTPEAAQSFLAPVLAEIGQGRTDLTLLGVVVGLWSGSRLVRSLSEGVAVIHGAPRARGYAWSRALAVLLYLAALIAVGVAVAVIAVSPDLFGFLPDNGASEPVSIVVLGVVVAVLIVALYRSSVAQPGALRDDVVGAIVAVVGWVVGSLGLRVYSTHLFSDFSVYAAVAAPIAIMLWSYVTAFAVLLGAAVSRVLTEDTGSA